MSSDGMSRTVRPLNDFESPSMRTAGTSASNLSRPAIDPTRATLRDFAAVEERHLVRDPRLHIVRNIGLRVEDADVVIARPAELRVRLEVIVDEFFRERLGFRTFDNLR